MNILFCIAVLVCFIIVFEQAGELEVVVVVEIVVWIRSMVVGLVSLTTIVVSL